MPTMPMMPMMPMMPVIPVAFFPVAAAQYMPMAPMAYQQPYIPDDEVEEEWGMLDGSHGYRLRPSAYQPCLV